LVFLVIVTVRLRDLRGSLTRLIGLIKIVITGTKYIALEFIETGMEVPMDSKVCIGIIYLTQDG